MASYLDSTGVTSLTSDIKALTDAAYPANATIINGYSSSSAYSVGDFCIHGGLFYKCNTAIASGGETWNSSHWTQTNVTSEWGTKMVVLSYGNNTWADFEAAFNANAIVYCKASSNSNPGTGSQDRMAFMAFVNYSNNTITNVEFQYYRSVSSHSASQQGDQVFIYKLENTNGGTWSVTARETATKMVAGTGLSSSYSSGTLTMSVASEYQIPSGGTTGQVLAKKTDTDRDLEWVNQSGGGQLVVTITKSGSTYTSNKTITEILSAISNGQEVIAKYNDEIHCLCEYYNNNYQKEAHFSLVYWNSFHTYIRLFVIRDSSGNTVTTYSNNRIDPDTKSYYSVYVTDGDNPGTYNILYGDDPGTFVHYDQSFDRNLLFLRYCKSAMDWIYAEGDIDEYEDYQLVHVKTEYDDDLSNYVSEFTFCHVTEDNGDTVLKTFSITGAGWGYTWVDATVTYSEQTIGGGGGLPSVTSSDNGKVLRVVNGVWAAAQLPSASGVSF